MKKISTLNVTELNIQELKNQNGGNCTYSRSAVEQASDGVLLSLTRNKPLSENDKNVFHQCSRQITRIIIWGGYRPFS